MMRLDKDKKSFDFAQGIRLAIIRPKAMPSTGPEGPLRPSNGSKPANAGESNGFTLLEALLYLAIFGAIIGSIVGLSNLAISQRVENQVITEVNYQAEAVVASIIQTVQSASSVTTPDLGGSSSHLDLVMPNPATNPTIYDANNDDSTTRLRISEGSPAVRSYLTNSHVTVSELTFTNAGLAGSKGSIKIQFDLAYKSNSDRQEYKFAKTYYGTANIR